MNINKSFNSENVCTVPNLSNLVICGPPFVMGTEQISQLLRTNINLLKTMFIYYVNKFAGKISFC